MAVTARFIGSQPKLAVGRSHASGAGAARFPSREGSAGPLAQLASLALRETAPDSEALVVGQCVLQALRSHLARCADALRVAGGAALLGEEGFRIGLRAEGVGLPGERI